MGSIARPLVGLAVAELGPALARAAAATAGALAAMQAAIRGSSDAKDDTRQQAPALSLPRMKPCEECPPGCTGRAVRTNVSMPEVSRVYQGRITGRPYSIKPAWSEEWRWMGVDFDGFQPQECLMQEAKARYDQFVLRSGEALWFFEGFKAMREQVKRQARAVHANPPTRLLWYFMTPRAREYMLPVLTDEGVPSVVVP